MKVYIVNGNRSCRKFIRDELAKGKTHQVISLSRKEVKITKEDIIKMLELSENGFEDMLSKKSNIYNETKGLEKMSTSEMIDFIIDNPTILKFPIRLDRRNVQYGYNPLSE